MSIETMPRIRLTIEDMKHSIIHHFSMYQEKVSEYVDKEIEKVIEDFDYEEAVKKSASEIISESIDYYFKYGDGKEIISEAITEALNKTFKKDNK